VAYRSASVCIVAALVLDCTAPQQTVPVCIVAALVLDARYR
jgi:hypothetical protein